MKMTKSVHIYFRLRMRIIIIIILCVHKPNVTFTEPKSAFLSFPLGLYTKYLASVHTCWSFSSCILFCFILFFLRIEINVKGGFFFSKNFWLKHGTRSSYTFLHCMYECFTIPTPLSFVASFKILI